MRNTKLDHQYKCLFFSFVVLESFYSGSLLVAASKSSSPKCVITLWYFSISLLYFYGRWPIKNKRNPLLPPRCKSMSLSLSVFHWSESRIKSRDKWLGFNPRNDPWFDIDSWIGSALGSNYSLTLNCLWLEGHPPNPLFPQPPCLLHQPTSTKRQSLFFCTLRLREYKIPSR